MSTLTVAVCTYNRAPRLPSLIAALRSQECPIPFEILVVDNNSTDTTQEILKSLADMDGARLRCVREGQQGIVQARNRAIEEAKGSDYLAFIDDDELPAPGWMTAAVDALKHEEAECVGGEIRVDLPAVKRPSWLEEDLLGFLGQVRYGSSPFWITDRPTPVWSGNIAYRTLVFADGLRFDSRYDRKGDGAGGGSDAIMFATLLERGARIRYRPDMAIHHLIDDRKLKKSYFLRLHYLAGVKMGRYGDAGGEFERGILGVPLFMLNQALHQWSRALLKFLKHEHGALRQAMNGAHATGMIVGRMQRRKGEMQ